MNAFLALIFAVGLISACKPKQDPEQTSSTVSSNGSGPQESSSNEAQKLSDEQVRRENLIKQHLAHKSASNSLVIYDTCKDTWVDTGLPFREEPSFPGKQPTSTLRKPAITYKVGGKKVRLHEVDIYNLDTHALPGKDNVPKGLRGMWWMDGNPVPEIVLSFGRSVYDKAKGTITSTYNDQDSYIMQPSTPALAFWNLTLATKVKIQARVPPAINMDNLKFGDKIFVDIVVFSANLPLKTSLMPTTYVSDQQWKRETGTNCYNFRQIVDENGKKLPVYDLFVKNVMQQTKDARGSNPEVLVMPKYVD